MCSTQVNDKLTGELPLFCPLESCSHYQKPDNKIKKDGIYRTQSDPVPRQMYYCYGGVFQVIDSSVLFLDKCYLLP
jgi:hypothetical protein